MSLPTINHNSVGATRICDDAGNTVNTESGALAVVIQDQHSPVVSIPFIRSISTKTLTAPVVQGEYTITVIADHGFIAGDELYIADTSTYQLLKVLSVNENTLTLDSPLAKAYAIAGTVVLEVSSALNVDGSTNRVTFSASLPVSAISSIDITGIRFHILDNAEQDDSKFGGITALTRGVVIQQLLADGSRVHFCNIKSNADFQLVMDNAYYAGKAAAGSYGFTSDWRIKDNLGVTIRLTAGDRLDLIVQDNLTTLMGFRGWIYGHAVV